MLILPNICCTQYSTGDCTHPEAPRGLFGGKATCIKVFPFKSRDPRIGRIDECKIRVPFERPPIPRAPPKVL